MVKILGLLGAVIAPPAAAFAFLQTWAKAHPVLALLLLAAYEALVLGLGFVGKLVGGTADELNRRWKDPLAKSIDERTRRRLSGFGRRYRNSVLGSLRFIDLKGLATMGFYTPQLDEVFVDVSLVHSDPATVPAGVLGQRHVDPVRRSISDLIDKPSPAVLAVIGAPGCGKTTLLRHTALQVCRQRRRRRRVPALLYLRDHIQAITEGTALPDLIHPDSPAGWFEQKLRAGKCVVLLDGLDEVADQKHRSAVSDWVERQVAHYPLNDFVITSRPHGYQSAPVSGADVVQVRGFTDEQVTRFVRGWYLGFEQRSTGEKSADVTRRAAAEADDLLERLRQNHTLYELTVNPLLLTMISNVHKFRGALPGSRVDLYSEICQVLLWRRQEAKKLASELTGDQKMVLLSGLAFTMMRSHIRDLSRDQLATEFRSGQRRMAPGMAEADLIADMTSSGLLLEREPGLYAFAHLTFQEYLAAHHIREKQLTQVLMDNVDDVWWREATLLHVARGNADPIVQSCLDSGTVRALSLAFDCAEQAGELDAGLRTRLDGLLDSVFTSKANTPLRRLMIHVVVSQHLRRLIRTDEGTRLCADMVTNRIYQLFLETHPLCRPDGRPGLPNEPVLGVRFEDAKAFVAWVNEGGVSEQTYRLPHHSERESSALARQALLFVWVEDEDREFLSWNVRNPFDGGTRVYLDLANDFALLPEIVDAVLTSEITSTSTPGEPTRVSPRLRVLKLNTASIFNTLKDRIGRALFQAVDARFPDQQSSYPKQFRHLFTSSIGVTFPLPFEPTALVDRVREARLATWGAANLPGFVEVAGAVLSRAEPLTDLLAAELRIAAMCLSLETNDEDLRRTFQEIAAAVSFMERRLRDTFPATEAIILATD